MRSPQQLTLPLAPLAYSVREEAAFRRAIEYGYQLLRSDVKEARDFNDKQASLAIRRHQFLLMGAHGG